MTSCRHIYSIWFKSNQQILSKPQNMETRARFMSGLRTTVDRTTKGAIHAKIAAISPGKETLGNTHKYTKLKQERNPHQYTTIGFAWEIKKCYIIWVCFQQLHKFLWFAVPIHATTRLKHEISWVPQSCGHGALLSWGNARRVTCPAYSCTPFGKNGQRMSKVQRKNLSTPCNLRFITSTFIPVITCLPSCIILQPCFVRAPVQASTVVALWWWMASIPYRKCENFRNTCKAPGQPYLVNHNGHWIQILCGRWKATSLHLWFCEALCAVHEQQAGVNQTLINTPPAPCPACKRMAWTSRMPPGNPAPGGWHDHGSFTLN